MANILLRNEWGEMGKALRRVGLTDGAGVWEDKGSWQEVWDVMRRLGEEGWEPISPLSPLYPPRLRARLGWRAPALLWGKDCYGGWEKGAVAIVGSRDLSPDEEVFAWETGRLCARWGFRVVSGGARGADQLGARGCLEGGGFAVHFLPGGQGSEGLAGQGLLSVNPEEACFDRLRALQRNRWIYGSAEVAVVVSSRFGVGGAWSGALESLRGRLCPLVVYRGKGSRDGNEALARLGAHGVSSVDEMEEIFAKVGGYYGFGTGTFPAFR